MAAKRGDDLLVAELGSPLFAVIGGETSDFAAIKARLLKRKPAAKKYFLFFEGDGLDAGAIEACLAKERLVAVRCSREVALTLWPPLAARCAKGVRVAADSNSLKSPLVAKGSFVAMRADVTWCLGGFQDQRDCQRASKMVVDEAKRRAEAGRRDFFVSRPTAVFDDLEKHQRLAHLFPSVKDWSKLKIDEEAAYSVSNEMSAAKVAKIARGLALRGGGGGGGGGDSAVIDATACVGGNALAFARCFSTVVAIEIDPLKVGYLRENIAHVRSEEAVGEQQHRHLKRLTEDLRVVQGDCLAELPGQLDALAGEGKGPTVVFADPPWGGGRRFYASSPSPASSATALSTPTAAATSKKGGGKCGGQGQGGGSDGGGAGDGAVDGTGDVHLKGGGGGLSQLVRLCAGHARCGALLLKLPGAFDTAALAAELAAVGLADGSELHELSKQVKILVVKLPRELPPPGERSPAPRENSSKGGWTQSAGGGGVGGGGGTAPAPVPAAESCRTKRPWGTEGVDGDGDGSDQDEGAADSGTAEPTEAAPASTVAGKKRKKRRRRKKGAL